MIRFLFTLLLFASLFLPHVNSLARDIRIHIAVTSDVHARLFAYDFVENKPARTSMANVHYVVQAMRAREGTNLILLDNGDLIQGTPAAYYANFVQESDKNLFSRVMNYMRFDAATVGNHDIEAGPEVYNRLISEFNFPWLGANVLDVSTGEPYFQPYVIVERQNIRVAILGLTTIGVPNWLPQHLWEGLEFQDMVEAARYWVTYIRENEQPDALIGLFHSGLGPLDPDPSAHPLENASGYIARHVPGFDLIFSAHDHRRRIQTVVNTEGEQVMVLGGGHFAENLALAELRFERLARREFRLKDIRADMISTLEMVPSHSFIRRFEDDVQEIIQFANQEIATLTSSVASMESLFGSAAFTDMVHEIQLKLTGADISFTAPLAFDQNIAAGKLRMRDFFKLYEFENYLYTVTLSGQEIKNYLEYSYALWFNEMRNEEDHLLNLHRDVLGRVPDDRRGRRALSNPSYNFDSAAGINYVVDVSMPAGSRLTISGFEDGRSFELHETYNVAINSYRGSGGGGHLVHGAGIPRDQIKDRITATTDTDLRSLMVDFFRKKGVYNPVSRDNWKLIPEAWVEKGKAKDLEYLRP